MRDTTLLLVAASALAIGLAGCGPDKSDFNRQSTTSDAGPTSSDDGSSSSGEDGGEENGEDPAPTIESFSIEPTEITTQQTGMTDEYFEATLTVSGFPNGVDSVAIAIRAPQREAPDGNMTTDGNDVTIDQIPQSWFQGLDPGAYDIGATVNGPQGHTAAQWGLATVTVTE